MKPPVRLHQRTIGVFALLVCLGVAPFASAQVAYEGHTGSAKVTSASTTGPSFPVTCDGSANEKLFVAIAQQNATASVTYNGVSMTEVPTDSPQLNSGYYIRFFYLDSPASGSNTVAVTWGAAILGNAVGACYSGAAAGLDSHAGDNAGGSAASTIAKATTVVATNSWLVAALVTSGATTAPMVTSGGTLRVSLGDANTIMVALADSNAAVGSGSQSIAFDTNVGDAFIAEIIVSIAPSGGGGGSTRKRMPICCGQDR